MQKHKFILCIILLLFQSCNKHSSSINDRLSTLENRVQYFEQQLILQEKTDSILKSNLQQIGGIARFANLSPSSQEKIIALVPYIANCNSCYQRIFSPCLSIEQLEIAIKCMANKRKEYHECLENCKAYTSIMIN